MPVSEEAARRPLLTFLPEINLNGGIVANKGFVKQFATPGTKVIQGKYVSAWGGIQSTGQFIGQVVRRAWVARSVQVLADSPYSSCSNMPRRDGAVNPLS